MAMRAVVYRAALHISKISHRTTSSLLYTPTLFQFSTHASKNATQQSLLHPPKTKSQNQDQTERKLISPGYENILEVSEDEELVDKSMKRSQDTWKLTESTILKEIQPITRFVRQILHSHRYKDGELLSFEDEEKIVERLLQYHPRFKDKIGCGFDSIMVGQHPEFESSRCLFIIQKNGQYTDFSYKKCLEGFIRKKYPSFAEKFIAIHFR